PMLHDRLQQGVALYQKEAAPKLLVSGDHGREEYDEVNAMKRFAEEQGVPSEDVFMDHAGFSTYESVYRARDIFQVRRMVIVTQEYHLSRALYIAKRLGIEAWGVPADPRTYSGQTARDLREILARDKDFLTCILKPKPTYLGKAIPVNGNGNLTNDGNLE
ncbi:MAG: vancomycin high temperature exclusion protein, partial [Neglectibacter sp.]